MSITLGSFPPDLTGISAAQRGMLNGDIIFDEILQARFSESVLYDLHHRIIRSQLTGLLDFYYSVSFPGGAIPDGFIPSLQHFESTSVEITYANWRSDWPGTAAPRAIGLTTVQPGFFFLFGLGANPPASTRFFFISTNARDMVRGKAYFYVSDDPSVPALRLPGSAGTAMKAPPGKP